MDNIVYENNGKLTVVKPTPDALLDKSIDEIAQEIVPSGISYTLVLDSDMPSDSEAREYWELLPDNTVGISDANKIFIAKEKKLSELKEYYKSKTVRSLTYNNHLVYLTDSATRGADSKWLRLNINGDVTDITWGFDDGSTQVMTKADIELFTNFLSDNDERLRHMKRDHKAAINALTTEAEVNSYDITADINGLSWI